MVLEAFEAVVVRIEVTLEVVMVMGGSVAMK